ncbi:DUF106 domain-containing protein [Candidatus Woesearchaeota archaeon]|nr:DUF106 domain-containing protein [Candidatus Woesearchaeota archaeon]
MVFESVVDPVFRPLLGLHPFWAVLIISLVLALLTTLIYKWFTDQEKMRGLKAELKGLQQKMKEQKEHPEQMLSMQKEAMQKNLEYMKHSFKPMLITFLPLIIIFGWLNATLAFQPLLPNQEFEVQAEVYGSAIGKVEMIVPEGLQLVSEPIANVQNGKASWLLKGEEGEYLLQVKAGNEVQVKKVLITSQQRYEKPVQEYKESSIRKLTVQHQKLTILRIGSWQMGWLITYIILSIVFTTVLRKLFKLH